MNEDQLSQEKDFRSLISQFINFGESRDKQINEIDDILDRIKANRRPSVEEKQSSLAAKEPDDVITQLRGVIRKMNLANEKLGAIICRLNELV